MKISYKWLKNYIKTNVSPEELSVLLTNCGLEVESFEVFETIKGGLEGVYIGEVKSCEKHPDADKLSVTKVDIGKNELLDIVCGAPNVAIGQKVLVAVVGTTLYPNGEAFKIGKAKIRGVNSEGMICAEDELGIGTSHAGIMVLDESVVVGTPAAKYFNIESDYVFEIGITPNRADATSHIGVARDLVAVLNNIEKTKNYKVLYPDVDAFVSEKTNKDFTIEIEDASLCPRYTGLLLENVNVNESPEWLKNYLLAIGLRSINTIVDITNFVLFETGQPLHAFDADMINGNKVIVKKLAKDGKFNTLDGVQRELNGEELMICNAKEGMCIAGVFGGEKSGVTKETTRVFLESACFNGVSIRKTSRYHNLFTDASFRYERGSDPNITVFAIKRAALLIKELAGGKIASDIIDIYPNQIEAKKIQIYFSNIDRLIGKNIEQTDIIAILNSLEIETENINKDGFLAIVPTNKPDVTREADIIEEILRVYGYNNIEISETVKSSISYISKPDKEKTQNAVSDFLVSNGFVEIMNNSLTKSDYYTKFPEYCKGEIVQLLNPLSKDLSVMRTTLLFGGLETILYNVNRKQNNLKLFEFGKTYFSIDKNKDKKVEGRFSEQEKFVLFTSGFEQSESWKHKQEDAGFYYIKSVLTSLFKRSNIKANVKEHESNLTTYGIDYIINDKCLATVGLVKNDLLKYFDIKQDVFYAEIDWKLFMQLQKKNIILYNDLPKYPAVKRDLALLIDKEIKFSDIELLARKTEKKLLKEVVLFDIYQGEKIAEDKKSYAVSFILQHDEKTLTDYEIDVVMKHLADVFVKELRAVIR